MQIRIEAIYLLLLWIYLFFESVCRYFMNFDIYQLHRL